MNAYAPLAGVLTRIAITTSLVRVRGDDTGRADNNGGSINELRDRVEALVTEFRQIADELEETLA